MRVKLRKNLPIDQQLSKLRAPRRVQLEGEVWRAVPDGAFAQYWNSQTGKPIEGGHGVAARNPESGAWEFRLEHFDVDGQSVEWLKVWIDKNGRLTDLGPRYGVVAGRLHELDFGMIALVPGYSSRGKGSLLNLPVLSVDYRGSPVHPRVGFDIIHYAYCGIYSMLKRDLLRSEFSVQNGTTQGGFCRSLAREILREVLGLAPLSRLSAFLDPSPKEIPSPCLRRGELVAIRFATTWTPCLVVSPNEYNSQVAQCVVVRHLLQPLPIR